MTSGVVAPRVQETTTTTGTGTITLGGAATQCQTFASGIGSGGVCSYVIISGNGLDWEEGIGKVGGTGPYTLTRSPTRSSVSGNAAITLTGSSTVFADPSSDSIDPTFYLTPTFASSASQSLYSAGGSTWNFYPSSLTFPAATGDVWRVRAVIKKTTGGTSNAAVAITDSSYANGYVFWDFSDGNQFVSIISSGAVSTAPNSPGGSSQRNNAAWTHVEAEVSFGGSGIYNQYALRSYAVNSQQENSVSFVGTGSFTVLINADAKASIGRVILKKIS